MARMSWFAVFRYFCGPNNNAHGLAELYPFHFQRRYSGAADRPYHVDSWTDLRVLSRTQQQVQLLGGIRVLRPALPHVLEQSPVGKHAAAAHILGHQHPRTLPLDPSEAGGGE